MTEKSEKLIDLGDGITVEVVREKKNPVIGRIEYYVLVHHVGKGTPPIPELRVKFAQAIGKDHKVVYIRRLLTEYGIGRSKAVINVYDSEDLAKQFEPKFVIERNKTLEEEIAEAEARGE